VFVSSHLLWEVEAMCDRVGVLARGRLVAQGSPGELRSGGDTVQVTVDDPKVATAVAERMAGMTVLTGRGEGQDGSPVQEGILRVRVTPPATTADLNAALVSAGVGVSALIPERATLEEVFLALTEGADVPR
jgi:ABC-2 type transport system ATP-binding protein